MNKKRQPLEDHVSTKTDHRKLQKANIHERAAIAKTVITDTSAKMQKKVTRCHGREFSTYSQALVQHLCHKYNNVRLVKQSSGADKYRTFHQTDELLALNSSLIRETAG